MINVSFFYRTSAYKGLSMEIFADNLCSAMKGISDIAVFPFRPEEFRLPFLGRFITQWLYYPSVASSVQKDINHICDYSLSHLITKLDRMRTVITCHDLMALEVPKSTVFWKRKTLLHYLFRNMLKARKIIAVSWHTKEDILKYSSYNSKDIVVIYNGVNSRFKHIEKDKTEEKFNETAVLHVGSDNFYKNVEGAIKAISALGRKIRFIKVGPISRKQLRLLRKLKIDFVQFPYLSDEQLIQVYNSVDLLVFPSWHEGFGFPVVEAMACGCPVVSSNAASLPEVAGDAAIMVSPEDVRGISKAIEKILDNQNLRQELIEKGFKQANKFTWEKAAKETVGVYNSLLS